MFLTDPSQLNYQPKRIVSLVPSQTELLHTLGLNEEVIGITRFCIHPAEWFRTKKRIGGTKDLHIDQIKSLKPDLIIANKEENVQEQVASLANDFSVWVTDVFDLPSALQMIDDIGKLTNRISSATSIRNEIESGFLTIKTSEPLLPAAYLIWNEPLMTIGQNTFIHDMLLRAGFRNVFEELKRYPVITIEDLQNSGCKHLLLSSEPFPFGQKHVDKFRQLLPDTHIEIVDGELFSWYGSRLLYSPAYFKKLHIDCQ